MKCNEIDELLSLYIDRMLDEGQAKEVEEHLSSCDSCRKEYNEMKETIDLLGQSVMLPVPDTFRLRLRKALDEEKQNMADSGVIGMPSKMKNKWRIITSVAAIFVVGVITFSLYNDVLGILPDRLNGGEQTGAAEKEKNYDTFSGASGSVDDSADIPNTSSDGSVVMKDQAEDLQPMPMDQGSAAADEVQNYSSVNGNDTALRKEVSSEEQMTVYGMADGTEPVDEEEAVMAADSEEPEEDAAAEGIDGNLAGNSKLAASPEECSRSLTSSGVERNTAAVQYYNNLIEEKLKNFDYQVLETRYAQTGEWQFRIFIFRGKDGNTYNEEILISGKDGEIEVICSNEFTGL